MVRHDAPSGRARHSQKKLLCPFCEELDDPQYDDYDWVRLGFQLRDNVRTLYENAELAYVVPSIEFTNWDGRRRFYFPYHRDAGDWYPVPRRIGAVEFKRTPGPIFCWRVLSMLADDRFGQLRETVFARNRESSIAACRFVNDSVAVPASRLVAQSRSFGGGAAAPGSRMLRYYHCAPCTPAVVERAAERTNAFCMAQCSRYARLVRQNLSNALANAVFCRSEPDPVTLEQSAPMEFRRPGMVALVPVVNEYRSPPRHEESPVQNTRTSRAVCLNRGDLICSMRGAPAVDPTTGDAFFGIPMTVEEWSRTRTASGLSMT